MTKYDFYWKTNEAWYTVKENLECVVRDDAPPEAKDSYNRYLQQKIKVAETRKRLEETRPDF